MSKALKGIGKVFKKVAKVVMKVAPFALAAAAVVFTGGAALGILPTFGAAVGGVVSSLGLSAGLTGALTGAVTSAGFGAAIGGVMGGKKGMQKGFLTGMLTGGLMGAASPSAFGIVKDPITGLTTTTNTLAHGGNAFGAAGKGMNAVAVKDGIATVTPKGMAPTGAPISAAPGADPWAKDPGGILGTPKPAPTGALTSTVNTPLPGAPSPVGMAGRVGPTPTFDGTTAAGSTIGAAPAPAAPAGAGMAPAAAQGGVMGFLNQNPTMAGTALKAIGGVLGGDDDEAEETIKARNKRSAYLYGDMDANDPFGMAGAKTSAVPKPRYYYDATANRVVDRQQQGAG